MCLQVEEFCQASLNTTALMKEETGMQLLLHAGDLSYARCGWLSCDCMSR